MNTFTMFVVFWFNGKHHSPRTASHSLAITVRPGGALAYWHPNWQVVHQCLFDRTLVSSGPVERTRVVGTGSREGAFRGGSCWTAIGWCAFLMPANLSADRLETFLHKLRVEDGQSIQTANDWLLAVRQFVR